MARFSARQCARTPCSRGATRSRWTGWRCRVAHAALPARGAPPRLRRQIRARSDGARRDHAGWRSARPARIRPAPRLPPFVEYPRVYPAVINPAAGQQTTIGVYYAQPVTRTLDILRLHDDQPRVDPIRTLRPNESKPQGWELLTWDGRTEDGTLAPPGRYAAHVRAFWPSGVGSPADGLSWVFVVPSTRDPATASTSTPISSWSRSCASAFRRAHHFGLGSEVLAGG